MLLTIQLQRNRTSCLAVQQGNILSGLKGYVCFQLHELFDLLGCFLSKQSFDLLATLATISTVTQKLDQKKPCKAATSNATGSRYLITASVSDVRTQL